MKLYATVTSERASKGQGGEYLNINVQDANKSIVARLHIATGIEGLPVFAVWTKTKPFLFEASTSVEVMQNNPIAKGEKQKGKTCEVPDCKGEPQAYTGMRYGEVHYWCDEHK